ncbi:MAG: hypothetical protein HN395_02155, partial [Methylococcales bacterium]|nr:hypothetical protein [Methylococcales bacterium]
MKLIQFIVPVLLTVCTQVNFVSADVSGYYRDKKTVQQFNIKAYPTRSAPSTPSTPSTP